MSSFSKKDLLPAIEDLIPSFSANGKIDKLSGGNINHVWRIHRRESSIIAKYAPPHIATNPDVPLNDKRIRFEAKALKLFKRGGLLNHIAKDDIRPPKILAFDVQLSLLIMEDVGAFDELNVVDKQTFSSGSIGENLGTFIGRLHRESYQKADFRESFQNHEIQKVRYQLQYESAHEYAKIADEQKKEVIKTKSRSLGKSLQNPQKGKCLIMGDLWPPSVFVNSDLEIRLIDWEFVHFGRPLQDVGHFAAHCWMQQLTSNTTSESDWWMSLWTSFWSAYKHAAGTLFDELFDENEKQKIGIHIGTEILIRAFGPFKDGYVYQDYSEGDQTMEESKEMALTFITQPEAVSNTFGF